MIMILELNYVKGVEMNPLHDLAPDQIYPPVRMPEEEWDKIIIDKETAPTQK